MKVGDYAHFSGYGLVKIHKIDTDIFGEPRYHVKTGVSGSGFSFGIQTAHKHELKFVSDSDAKVYIQRMKASRGKTTIHSKGVKFPL